MHSFCAFTPPSILARGSPWEDPRRGPLVGGAAKVAGERQLEPAADRVPVQHRERDLRHVFEAVQRADPVAVERLADGSGRQRLPVHARGERPAGTTYDDESDGGIGSRRLRVIGERSGEVGVECVEHRGAVERDPGDALLDRTGDGGVVHRSALTRAGLWKRLTTTYDRGQRV